ncbi:olfactory receptor 11A1-like [Brachyistius frenatus]|uniref:olfactory receptor 11A1-like n=1 Tax=Brachyistius frenatus TaxID=100188 RepID=UPI0037E9C7CF
MINSSQVSFFNLGAYFDTGVLKYLYFMIIMCLYVVIVVSNVFLLVVICVNRSLHEPMYLFLCSLLVNELYGSSGLFPFLLLQILSDVHTVPAPFCFLQIFLVYSYGSIEFLNLSIISYDRYLAICYPLQYNKSMTYNKVAFLIALIWLSPILVNFFTLPLIVPLKLCGNIINKVYCDFHSVVKLACYDTTVINIYGLLLSAFSVFGPLILILYTYMRIFKVSCFEILQSRFNINYVLNVLRIFMSVYFLTCPPLFNPVMYGLKLSKIRVACKTLIRHVSY